MTDKVWISVTNPTGRPPLAYRPDDGKDPMLNVVEEARKFFQGKNWPIEDLNAMEQYVTGNGNPSIGRELGKMTKDQQALYFSTAVEVFRNHCEDRSLWKAGNPTRPGIGALIAKAKEKFTEKGWPLTRLNNMERYVNEQGNRAIGGIQSHMKTQTCNDGSVSQSCYQAYSATVITTFAQACGLQQFNMPTLTNNLQQVTVGEQTVTLNGT
ncbi:MAG: hypothetical protein WC500_05900, partial [Candidatus Margulisiibacteriota bacterium]